MIYYNYIMQSAALFLCTVLIHIAISRLFLKINEDKIVFKLFLILPFLLYFVFSIIGLFSYIEYFPILILYLAISCAYVTSYPAIYAACPTLAMSLMIYKKRKIGLSVKDISARIDLKSNSIERIDDALDSKLIESFNDQTKLTKYGKSVYFLFSNYRKILGLKESAL